MGAHARSHFSSASWQVCSSGAGQSIEMDRSAELQANVDAVNKEIAATRKRLRAEADKQKQERRKEKNAWKLKEGLRNVLLIAYVLAGYTAIAAAKYLIGEAARRKWSVKPEEEVRMLIEDLFLAATEQELADLCHLPDPKDPRAAKMAVRLVEEWRLAAWVENLNYARGVAPSTEAVLQRLGQQLQALPAGVRPDAPGVSAEGRARMWAMRWRRKWGAKYGSIRPKEDIQPAEMRQKASAGNKRNTV